MSYTEDMILSYKILIIIVFFNFQFQDSLSDIVIATVYILKTHSDS